MKPQNQNICKSSQENKLNISQIDKQNISTQNDKRSEHKTEAINIHNEEKRDKET